MRAVARKPIRPQNPGRKARSVSIRVELGDRSATGNASRLVALISGEFLTGLDVWVLVDALLEGEDLLRHGSQNPAHCLLPEIPPPAGVLAGVLEQVVDDGLLYVGDWLFHAEAAFEKAGV